MEQVEIKPYKNSLDYLFDELKLLELYLGVAVIKFRKKSNAKKNQSNEFSEAYVSDEEIDSAIQPTFDEKKREDEFEKLYIIIDKQKNIIEKRKAKSNTKGTNLSFQHVCDVFELSDFEKYTILICIAPEIDLKFEKIYSYLQNNIAKKKPTVGFILDLLLDSAEEKISHRQYFLNNSILFRLHLVGFEQSQDEESVLAKSLKIDDHIVNFILGHEQLDPNLSFFSKLFVPENMSENKQIQIYKKLEKNLIEGIARRELDVSNNMFYLKGSVGIGKKNIVKSVCSKIFSPLLIVDVKDAMLSTLNMHDLSVLIFRQSALINAIIYLDNFDFLFSDSNGNIENEKVKTHFRESILYESEKTQGTVFLAGEKLLDRSLGENITNVDFQLPEYETRVQLWEFFLPEQCKDKEIIRDLANRFKFTPGQINNTVLSAKNQKVKNPIEINDVYNSCYFQCNQKLQTLAKKITKKHSLTDIILPDEKKQQLQDIISYVKNRNKVYFEWGFANKLSSTDGLNILFSGESGIGKTMAASIIAKELNLEIYKIDLSSVVSKYIGETEKNLDHIFKEAQTSNAVLFFDEADALFGKRSEVKDAHDRYANVEIDYLLQKLEEHREIIILASNLAQNIDTAFARRMHFRIEFEFPNKKSRLEIWKNIFPKNTPLEKNIDFEYISKFEITGGNIKNVALAAAFMAADKNTEISMKHLIFAVKKEFEKIGKPITKSEFESYYV